MDTCVVCGSLIIKSQDVKSNGYLNAVPWIQVRYFKVTDGKDNVAMTIQFCSTQCLAKYANVNAGTLERV
jgi:hypothetical protein